MIALTLASAAVLLPCGCSSTRSDSVDQNVHWLDDDRVEAEIKNQWRTVNRSSDAYSRHVRQVLELQKRADILLGLPNQDNLETLASRVSFQMPEGRFPISDLKNYISSQSHRRLQLVVVVAPEMFPHEAGKPSELSLMRDIDGVLSEIGVRRRVFQSIGNSRYLKLDSEELTQH